MTTVSEDLNRMGQLIASTIKNMPGDNQSKYRAFIQGFNIEATDNSYKFDTTVAKIADRKTILQSFPIKTLFGKRWAKPITVYHQGPISHNAAGQTIA